MSDKIILRGTIVEDLSECEGNFINDFFQFKIKCDRLSGNSDILKVYISVNAGGLNLIVPSTRIEITGVIRTERYEIPEENRTGLNVFVECNKFKLLKKTNKAISEPFNDFNEVSLSGVICKGPFFRYTKRNKEITEFIFRVRIRKDLYAFIPCICWGNNALLAADFTVGTKFDLIGRLQSRNYVKVSQDGTTVTKTTYEVSISKIENILMKEE